jgi:N-acyl amino acid synthase of PEP-CTERM/exosortase system
MQELIEPINLRELFALRYQVYCVERSFLSPNEYPNGEESDPFDASAVHFAALDRAGKVLGSVRLVQHTEEFGFPYQEHCRNIFPGAKELPTVDAAEISRLVVSKMNLRRLEDQNSDFIDIAQSAQLAFLASERRSGSGSEMIVLGLYKAIYQYCLDSGITYWYAAMERSLVRLLARYGVSFYPIGPKTDYFGPVIPHCVSLTSLQSSVGQLSEKLLDWFNDPEPNSRNGIRVIRLTSQSHRGAKTNWPRYVPEPLGALQNHLCLTT